MSATLGAAIIGAAWALLSIAAALDILAERIRHGRRR